MQFSKNVRIQNEITCVIKEILILPCLHSVLFYLFSCVFVVSTSLFHAPNHLSAFSLCFFLPFPSALTYSSLFRSVNRQIYAARFTFQWCRAYAKASFHQPGKRRNFWRWVFEAQCEAGVKAGDIGGDGEKKYTWDGIGAFSVFDLKELVVGLKDMGTEKVLHMLSSGTEIALLWKKKDRLHHMFIWLLVDN